MRARSASAATIAAWAHTIVGQSFIAGTAVRGFIVKDGIDRPRSKARSTCRTRSRTCWSTAHHQGRRADAVVALGRHSHTAFVVESFLDELAHATGADPLELRRELWPTSRAIAACSSARREAAVAAAARPDARGPRRAQLLRRFVATVAEVSLEHGRRACIASRARRLRAACQPGHDRRRSSQGAVGFGLTAALYDEITLRGGRVEQSNFHDYRMLRMHEMPEVDVHIVQSDEASSGVGEPGRSAGCAGSVQRAVRVDEETNPTPADPRGGLKA
jgi:isoquinoline 1-oxidoreductase beta subunit